LQELRFESLLKKREDPERANAALTSLLSPNQCADLHTVDFRSVYFDQACLTNLGALANLHTLNWAWDDFRGEVFDGDAPAHPFFPQLLHYTQSHMATFNSFIKLAHLITSPKLQTVDLTCHNISPSRLKEVFKAIAHRFDRDALQEIRITRFTWSFQSEPLGNYPTTITTLSPLLPFSNIRILVINDTGVFRRPLKFQFDNTTLGEIASSFPLLETLIFGFKESDETWLKPYKVTLEGILPLVERCPRLRELHLRFNLSTNEPPTIDAGFTGSCPNLHTLNIFDSPISHGEEMGAILAQLFPKPPTLSFDTSVRRSEWRKVDEVFAGLYRD
jgi:hypothetical protein